MKNRKALITITVVVTLIGTALGVVYWRFYNLPHPKIASHAQLLYWVALKELGNESPDIRVALVNRFADEANKIFTGSMTSTQLSDTQSSRLLRNIEILKQTWFFDRIAQYKTIKSPAVKEKYLEKQITLLDEIGNIAFENAQLLYPDKDTEQMTTISGEMLADIDRWLKSTPSEEKQSTSQAVREATVFWLTTQDLSAQVPAAREELVTRVIAELENGMDLKSTTSVVSGDRVKILKKNAMLLMESWFHQLADQYSSLDRKERTPFIDQKIEAVQKWNLIGFLTESDTNKEPDQTGATSEQKNGAMSITEQLAAAAEFNKIIDGWIESADDVKSEKLDKLKKAIQRRMFSKFF